MVIPPIQLKILTLFYFSEIMKRLVILALIFASFFTFGCFPDSKPGPGSSGYDPCDYECTEWSFTPSPCLANEDIVWTYDDCGCATNYNCVPVGETQDYN